MPESSREPSRTILSVLPHSAVGNIPVEIWSKIFSEACTDGGRTGRSLSLVSKYIRDTSKPYKYQCLLVEERRLRPLVNMLKRIPIEFRRIQHLFLSSNERSFRHRVQRRDRFSSADKNRLLVLASSTLRTLEIASCHTELYLGFQMPALLDLTIHNTVFSYRLPSRPIVCYPRLQRFHLASCRWMFDKMFLSILTTVAPGTRELRVSFSCLEVGPDTIPRLLDAFAPLSETHDTNHPQTISPTSLPSALQKIILQPSFIYTDYPYQLSNMVTETLREIRREDDRFVLLTEDLTDRHFSHEGRAITRRSWNECRAGDRDCWNPADEQLDTME